MLKTYVLSSRQPRLKPKEASVRQEGNQQSSLKHGPSISCQDMTLWGLPPGTSNIWTVQRHTTPCPWQCHWTLPPRTGLTAFSIEQGCIRYGRISTKRACLFVFYWATLYLTPSLARAPLLLATRATCVAALYGSLCKHRSAMLGHGRACSAAFVTARPANLQVSAPEVEGVQTGAADEEGQGGTVTAAQLRSSLHVQVCLVPSAVCMLEAVSIYMLMPWVVQPLHCSKS